MHQSHFTYAIHTAGFDYFSMFLKTTLLSWLRYCYHRCEKNDENDGLLYSNTVECLFENIAAIIVASEFTLLQDLFPFSF